LLKSTSLCNPVIVNASPLVVHLKYSSVNGMGLDGTGGSIKSNATCSAPVVKPSAVQLIVNVPATALSVQLNKPELLILTPLGGVVKLHVGLVSASPLLLVAVYCILPTVPTIPVMAGVPYTLTLAAGGFGVVMFNVTLSVPVVKPLAAQLIVNVPAAALAVQLNKPELLILTPASVVILHVGLVSDSPLLLVAVYCILPAVPTIPLMAGAPYTLILVVAGFGVVMVNVTLLS
jgi:hypothetical protein